MDIKILKDSLASWIRTDTWEKSHPNDEKRYNQALSVAFRSLGPSIAYDYFRQAMQQLVDEHHPGLLKSKEIVQRIEEMAQRAEHIGSYLDDTGGI